MEYVDLNSNSLEVNGGGPESRVNVLGFDLGAVCQTHRNFKDCNT